MESSAQAAIQAHGLVKLFGNVRAVDCIDVDVAEGGFFGFLGPNGAGKTTTISMLTGLSRPDTGSIRIGGIDCSRNPKAAQHLIGVVPDESNLYPELTGFENLCFSGALYGLRKHSRQRKAHELLDLFGLDGAAERKFSGYSKGMKRRLVIAAAIMHEPPILFLDEPTSGIDVESSRMIRSMLAALNRKGTTIFLTTHFIDEAERLCDCIAFIVNGKIVRDDRLERLLQPVQGRYALTVTVSGGCVVPYTDLQQAFPGLVFHETAENELRIESSQPLKAGSLVRFLEERCVEVVEARKRQLSLEDVFVEVTGIGSSSMTGGVKEGRGRR
jgi:ABC-2 type transport system ATP-binding protein